MTKMAPRRLRLEPAARAPAEAPGSDDDEPKLIATCRAKRYLPHLSDPGDAECPFWVWGYAITLHNPTDRPLTIYERYWTITPAGHDPQFTIGAGVGGKLVRLKPGETKSYISGVPLPTAKGGSMSGFFRALDDDGAIYSSSVVSFPLFQAKGTAPKPRAYTAKQGKAEAGATIVRLADYREKQKKPLTPTFDTADLPPATRQAFQREFFRMNKVRAFNSVKTGEIKRRDLMKVIPGFLGLDKVNAGDNLQHRTFEYSDIALFGEEPDWSDLRVIFLLLKDTYDFLRKSGIDPSHFPELAQRLHELLAAYRPAGRATTARKPPEEAPFVVPPELERQRPHTRTAFTRELLENDAEFRKAQRITNGFKYKKRVGTADYTPEELEEVRRANRFVQAVTRYRKSLGAPKAA